MEELDNLTLPKKANEVLGNKKKGSKYKTRALSVNPAKKPRTVEGEDNFLQIALVSRAPMRSARRCVLNHEVSVKPTKPKK